MSTAARTSRSSSATQLGSGFRTTSPLAYLFDPFRGKTLDAALGNLIESIDRRPRRVRVIFVNPTYGGQVLATGRFRLVKWQRGGLRDIRANRAAIFESC